MNSMHIASIALLSVATSTFGQARVIITEVMYNPNSNERAGETEWMEIANVGTESIDVNDWRLDDEDRNEWGKFSCTLAPGKVAVLVNAKAVNEGQFRAAWDQMSDSAEPSSKLDYQVIPVQWGGISNAPSKENEVLRLLDEKNEVICEVKQEGEWPSCAKPDGPSIALLDLTADNISNGALWRRSEDGQHGARICRKTDIFGGKDIGSPGFIPNTTAVVTKPEAPPEEPAEKPETGASEKIDY
jgi:hypothetical protein